MIEKILMKLGEEMLKQPDQKGWTPLHYAADMGNFNAVKTFLQKGMGREAAYMKNSDGNTALHLATVSHDTETMREIIRQCPDSSELVNNKGWNILHCAAQEDIIVDSAMKEILQSRTSLSNIINEKDAQGNTVGFCAIQTSPNNKHIYLGTHMDLGPKVWRPKYLGLGFEVYKYDIYKKPQSKQVCVY